LCIVKKMSFQKPKKDKSIISSNNGQKWWCTCWKWSIDIKGFWKWCQYN
jgi:hypothetical protein